MIDVYPREINKKVFNGHISYCTRQIQKIFGLFSNKILIFNSKTYYNYNMLNLQKE